MNITLIKQNENYKQNSQQMLLELAISHPEKKQ